MAPPSSSAHPAAIEKQPWPGFSHILGSQNNHVVLQMQPGSEVAGAGCAKCHPKDQPGTYPMVLAAAAAGGAHRMEKWKSAPGVLQVSSHIRVLGRCSGCWAIVGDRGRMLVLGHINKDAFQWGELMEKHSCHCNCQCLLSKAAGSSDSCFGKLLLQCTDWTSVLWLDLKLSLSFPSALSLLGKSRMQHLCRSCLLLLCCRPA